MVRHPDESFGSVTHEQGHGREVPRRSKDKTGSLSNIVNVQRLRDSMDWSIKALEPFTRNHVTAVRLTAGNRYGSQDFQKSPLNIMKLAVDIWLRQLVSQTPRTLVIPRKPNQKVEAYELQLALDYLLQQIRLGDALSSCARSAIYSMGVMKVGITSNYLHESTGFLADAGQPYAEPILIEDWIHDMNARRKEEWDWCGNRYRIPYEQLMENPDFNSKVKDKITPKDGPNEYDLGSMTGRTWDMSAGESFQDSEYRQQVEVYDIWIPYDRRYVTLPVQSGLGVLQEREWEGPENGPYHPLGFFYLPGNIMPLGPAQGLHDLQELITALFGQVGEQAARQKTLTLVDGPAEAAGDARAVMDSSDGAVVRVSHIDGIKEMRYGGTDVPTLHFVQWLKELASYLGGNIDTIGGLSPQAETLGQERLLAATSSEFIKHMQAQVTEFSTNVITDLGWYLYSDPVSELQLTKKVRGYGDIPFTYGPDSRSDASGAFSFQFQIQPHSLRARGPQERFSTLMDLTMKILLPMAPQLGEWGITLRFDKLMEYASQYADMPELQEIIQMAEPSVQQKAQEPATIEKRRPLQSPVTSREQVRTNRSPQSPLQTIARDMGPSQQQKGPE